MDLIFYSKETANLSKDRDAKLTVYGRTPRTAGLPELNLITHL